MRPIRLELEGFTAYREYTVLDFDGAELFVLTGPTGSGKSSIIDAITFALYGSVPRYQNPNLVHPVISQGKVEAKVRFDFAVEDRDYTVARVVRKTPRGGATTKEARLESNGLVLAGTADEITRKMREILGLNFEQFTTCVVLPQGDFARFLHEKPAQRQDLLTKLLGVDIYEKMGILARTREAVSRQKAQLVQEELERIQDATKSAKRKADQRLRKLEELKRTVEKTEPELEELSREVDAKQKEARRLEDEAELLEKLQIPDGVTELTGKIEKARSEYESARGARAETDELVQRAETARAELPDPAELKETRRLHLEHKTRTEAVEAAGDALVDARAKLEKASEARRESGDASTAAREALDQARRELAAHDLAAHLEKGEPCPVCQRVLETIPTLALPPALSNAEKDAERASSRRDESERAFRDREKKLALAEDRLQSTTRDLEALEKRLAEAPGVEDIEKMLRAIGEADDALAKARQKSREARAKEQRAHDALERSSEEEARAFQKFEKSRDALASLGPPRTEREDLGESWSKLHAWARELAPKQRRDAERAAADAGKAQERKSELLDGLRALGTDLGVELHLERPRDAVVSAVAEAAQEAKRIAEAIERAATLRVRVEAEREATRVAGALGQHLRATGFERWLLEEAFRRLVSGATSILNELSSGQYSFEYDEKLNFEVLDHRNADEQRSARTLSGGETFLASLALALTLAEQTADLAADGSARLESLFLDEGFGTLDDDTLEIVASAIEDLGAKGRIVGLVTHQQSLADKIAVQFRVTKGPVTATVEKIVA